MHGWIPGFSWASEECHFCGGGVLDRAGFTDITPLHLIQIVNILKGEKAPFVTSKEGNSQELLNGTSCPTPRCIFCNLHPKSHPKHKCCQVPAPLLSPTRCRYMTQQRQETTVEHDRLPDLGAMVAFRLAAQWAYLVYLINCTFKIGKSHKIRPESQFTSFHSLS